MSRVKGCWFIAAMFVVAVCASPCLPQSSELKDAIAASEAAAGANRWPEAEKYARRAVELAEREYGAA